MKLETIATRLNKLAAVFSTTQANEVGISTFLLKKLVREGEISRFGSGRSGVYLWTNSNRGLDNYMAIQLRYPKAIISGRTALTWWQLLDRQFTYLDLTVPRGYKIPNKFDGYIVTTHHVEPKFYEVGLTQAPTEDQSGYLNLYDPERALIDAFRFKTIADWDRNAAFENYLQSDYFDPIKLLGYINKFPGLSDLEKMVRVFSN